MKIEKTEIWITCEKPLQLSDVKAVRGFFGNMYTNRPEFHGHIGDRLIYRHPLIQYKIFGGSILIIGLKEGAYLLKAVPKIEYLKLHFRKHPIVKQNTISMMIPYGLTKEMMSYTFLTPWIGFNEKNYEHYLQLKQEKTNLSDFFNKILIGNILSICKSVGYTVDDKVLVKSKLAKISNIEIKKDVQLTAFEGEFETNFLIPDLWGIGGKVSIGYGTVKRKNGDETQ